MCLSLLSYDGKQRMAIGPIDKDNKNKNNNNNSDDFHDDNDNNNDNDNDHDTDNDNDYFVNASIQDLVRLSVGIEDPCLPYPRCGLIAYYQLSNKKQENRKNTPQNKKETRRNKQTTMWALPFAVCLLRAYLLRVVIVIVHCY